MITTVEEKELEPYIFSLTTNPELKNLTAEQIYSIALEMASQVKKAKSSVPLGKSMMSFRVNIDTERIKDISKMINDLKEEMNIVFLKNNGL
ncbi:hypothetical protein M2M59_03975 [Rummeliibacillus sp. G93]|uniref:hypothetical protein n=1 Tax=Rummeliibacillus sp. G93 TaxID=2939494 RepID=UPI00201C1E09|nr:hypothetical protein [Rummeliibacillus sp. G93]UQW98175.1 hypothetical protein M2M59_03975 [Rummeliibacillus sp. G93]